MHEFRFPFRWLYIEEGCFPAAGNGEKWISLLSFRSGEQATLAWTNPDDSGFDHVELWYGTAATADLRFTECIDPLGTVITNISNGTEYTFVVNAVDMAGNSSTGVTAAVTPMQYYIEIHFVQKHVGICQHSFRHEIYKND